MKNVKSFLGVDAGLVGCVRRLEINDKYYNLAASMHGGDIIAGLDIGKIVHKGKYNKRMTLRSREAKNA